MISQFRRQARELLEAYRAQSPDAVLEVDAYHRTATPETFALHDAQFSGTTEPVEAVIAIAERAEVAEISRRDRRGAEIP
jgi:hypothetical protein